MQYLSIDFLILYASLGITLFIGLRTGRGIKDIKEYATGNKEFTTGALVLTWLATEISGGGDILEMANTFKTEGIIELLSIVGWVLAYLVQGLIFAPRFLNFPNCMTMGDVMRTLYKGPSQIMTGILGALAAICIAGMEVTVLGYLAETLLGIDFAWGVALGGGLLILYTLHGGIKSVTYTDMFQFIVLIAVLPLITMLAIHHAGGMEAVVASLSETQRSITHHPSFKEYGIIFLSLGIFQFGIIDPALVQRILLAKSKQQVRHQFLVMSIFLFAILMSFMMLGFASNVLFPDDTDAHVVPQIIQYLLPTGLKGLAYAGVFAVTMSTFDSYLHAAGLTLVHDVISPIYAFRKKRIDELKLTRYITLLVGGLVIAIGLLRAENLYSFHEISYLCVGPLLAFPLFAGVLGLKPDQRAFYTASIVTIIALIICNYKLPEDYEYLISIIGACVNGIVFLGMHAIRHKGFAIVNYEDNITRTFHPQPKTWKDLLKPYLPTPKNIFAFSKKEVERLGAPNILVGLVGVLNYILPNYMWEHPTAEGYTLISYLRMAAGTTCGILAVSHLWSKKLSNYFPLFWHATLCFCLPFLNTFMLLMTNVSVSWLVNIAMSIVLLIMLVDWTMFFILSGIGISVAFLFYSQVVGPIHVDLDFSSGYFLIYQILFSLLICALFISKGHRRYALLAAEKKAEENFTQDNKAARTEAVRENSNLIETLRNGNIK